MKTFNQKSLSVVLAAVSTLALAQLPAFAADQADASQAQVETKQLSSDEAATLDFDSLTDATTLDQSADAADLQSADESSDSGFGGRRGGGGFGGGRPGWGGGRPGWGGGRPVFIPRPRPVPVYIPRPYYPAPVYRPVPVVSVCFARNSYGAVFQASGLLNYGILQAQALNICATSYNSYGCVPAGCR